MASPQASTLHNLIRKGDLAAVQSLLECTSNVGTLVNEFNAEGWNAVRTAVAFGRSLILEELLRRGAKEAPPREKDGWTSLHVACFHGFAACVEVLLDAGAVSCAAEQDDHGRWPIHCAVQRDHLECLDQLLSHRCDMNVVTRSNATSLHVAAAYGAVRCLERLLGTQRARVAMQLRASISANTPGTPTPSPALQHRSVLSEAIASGATHASSCVERVLRYYGGARQGATSTAAESDACDGASSSACRFSQSAAEWPHLVDGLCNAVEHGRLAALVAFLRFDDFRAAMFRPVMKWQTAVVTPTGEATSATAASKWGAAARGMMMISPVQKIFMSSASFACAAIRALIHCNDDTDRREEWIAALRRVVLTAPAPLESSEVPILGAAPLALAFSPFRSGRDTFLTKLFGGSASDGEHGVLNGLIDGRHLFVNKNEMVHTDVLHMCGVPCFNLIYDDRCTSNSMPSTDPRVVHLLRALLHMASSLSCPAGCESPVFRALAVDAMDSGVFFPCRYCHPEAQWSSLSTGDAQQNVFASAAACGLTSFFLDAKFKQLCRT